MAARNRRRGIDWEKEIRHRVNAGRVAVEGQIAFSETSWVVCLGEFKEDETPVTFADYAISEKVFALLSEDFQRIITAPRSRIPRTRRSYSMHLSRGL